MGCMKRRNEDGPFAPDKQSGVMKNAAIQVILSSTPRFIIVQDADGRLVLASDAFARTVGISPSDIAGKKWADIGGSYEMAPVVDELRRKVLHSSKGAHAEAQSRNGRRVSLDIEPLVDEEGATIGTLTTAKDITKQEELKELQERMAVLLHAVESVRDLVFVKDLEGRYAMVNPAVLQMMGRNIEEVLGHTDVEVFGHMEGSKALIENDTKVIRTGIGEMFEENVMLADGLHTFMSDKTPIRDSDGRVTGVIGIVRDITERKRMEEAEKAKGRWLESIMEGAPVAISVSRDGRIIYANSPYLRLFGFSDLEEIKGRLFIEQVAPEDQDKAMECAKNCSHSGSPALLVELTGLRKDGSRFPFQAAIAYAEMPDGPALLGFFTDITDSKRLEGKLEESRRATELYIDILTHDISNYNAAAIGYLQLAEMELKLDEREHGFISHSLQALVDSSELIANIRDLQNIEAGRDRLGLINVCTMLNEIMEAYRNPPDRDVSISLTVDGPCTVYASSLLRGAFSNLISNAIKHSKGPIDIQIRVGPELRGAAEMVRVDISDNGPGIPDARKEAIFDRSLMGLTKPVSRGLGLYLVKRLVENYAGEVWVEDRIPLDHSQGAKFVVLLPAARPAPDRPPFQPSRQ